jgi:hypothetical protein
VILPLEQVVHSFLLTLPMFATALLVLLYWTTAGAAGDWALRLRDPPWPAGILVGVLGASMLLGLLPGLAEWWQTRRYAPAVSSPEGTDHAAGQSGQPG